MTGFHFTMQDFQIELEKLREKIIEDVVKIVAGRKKDIIKSEFSDYISIKEACQLLGKSRTTINNWINTGKLKSFKKGNQRLLMRIKG